MKLFYFLSAFVFVNCLHCAFTNEVSYLKYCLNGTDPDVFPIDGDPSSGSIVMTPKPESSSWYIPDMNCSITFATEPNYFILLTFSNISLRNSSMDNLTIFYDSGNSNAVLAGQQVCSNENCDGLKFDSGNYNNITLKFISANVTVPSNVTGFKAQYTVYDLANPNTGACRDKHKFLCENKHCIFYDFVCDGHNNCGDLSDETKCEIPVKDTVWGIVAIVAAIIAIIVFVPCMFFLAISGTQNIVKLVTVPSEPTPLMNTADCGETSNLLSSSEATNMCWPGTSYDACSYGTVQHGEFPGNVETKKTRTHSQIEESQDNKVL